MKTLLLLVAMSLVSFNAAAKDKYLFKLKSVTCRLSSGKYVTGACKYLDGTGKSYCSIVHIDEVVPSDTYVTSKELKSGSAHVAMVGEKQYVTFSVPANGATVCSGYTLPDGTDAEAEDIIFTGELVDKVTYTDLGQPERDKK